MGAVRRGRLVGQRWLSMRELDAALAAPMDQTGMLGPFDLIGFDACLLGSWEVASSLDQHARYLLASEELEPGHGWDHSAVAVLQGGVDAEALGSALMEGFAQQARDEGTFARVTLALTRLDRIAQVSQALLTLTDAIILDGMKPHARAVGSSRAAVPGEQR